MLAKRSHGPRTTLRGRAAEGGESATRGGDEGGGGGMGEGRAALESHGAADDEGESAGRDDEGESAGRAPFEGPTLSATRGTFALMAPSFELEVYRRTTSLQGESVGSGLRLRLSVRLRVRVGLGAG